MSTITLQEASAKLKANDWSVRIWEGNAVQRIYVSSRYAGECGYLQFGPGDSVSFDLKNYAPQIKTAAGLVA